MSPICVFLLDKNTVSHKEHNKLDYILCKIKLGLAFTSPGRLLEGTSVISDRNLLLMSYRIQLQVLLLFQIAVKINLMRLFATITLQFYFTIRTVLHSRMFSCYLVCRKSLDTTACCTLTLHWGHWNALWLFHLVCILYWGCFNLFCNVWVFCNMCTCIFCVLYCLYRVIILFLLRIFYSYLFCLH